MSELQGGPRACEAERERDATTRLPIGLEGLAAASVKDVDLDACRAHGTWFDAGELRKVAEHFEADRTALPADVRRVLETIAGAYRSSGRRD